MNNLWHKRFLDLADYISAWSKDPSTKVGAVIVDPSTKRVLGLGYNGFPQKVADTQERLNDRTLKYPLMVHAEANAVHAAGKQNLKGSFLYVNCIPCVTCVTNHLIPNEIASVFLYEDTVFHPRFPLIKTQEILREAKIELHIMER